MKASAMKRFTLALQTLVLSTAPLAVAQCNECQCEEEKVSLSAVSAFVRILAHQNASHKMIPLNINAGKLRRPG